MKHNFLRTNFERSVRDVGGNCGKVEQRQNKEASHVNPMYRNGNPQNVFPEFKLQPK